MRRWVKILLLLFLLAGGAIICAIRWQAWFGMPAEPHWNGETIDYVFPTFEQDTTPQSLDILVLGDIHNQLTRADYDTLALRLPQADLVAQTGDWMERGQVYYRQLLLREWSNSRLYGMPAIVCPGNHEYSKGLRKTLSDAWSDTFTYPHNGPVGVPGANYYIDMPDLRFVVIDTNPLDRLVYLTRTATWLEKTMKEAGNRYVAVMMHHPVHSAGKGRANPLIYSAFRHALGQADLVLAGHDHSYMRHAPFVVLNTAGKPKPQRPHLHAEATDTVPVYGVIHISDPESEKSCLLFKVYRLGDNTLVDSLYVSHD